MIKKLIDYVKQAIVNYKDCLMSDVEIPKPLEKNIFKYNIAGIGFIFISIILMIVDGLISFYLIGILVGIFLIFIGIHLRYTYKSGNYVVYIGKCLDIKLSVTDNVKKKVTGNRFSGEKRKYIVEIYDLGIYEVKTYHKNDRIQKGMDVIIYLRPNSIYENNPVINEPISIDVYYQNNNDLVQDDDNWT